MRSQRGSGVPGAGDPETKSVLVLSPDALAAALLAARAEIEGYRPAFAGPGESPRDALRRVRPDALLAERSWNAADDGAGAAFIGPAKMLGARVILCGRSCVADHLRELARAHDVCALVLPPAPGELGRLLAGRPAP